MKQDKIILEENDLELNKAPNIYWEKFLLKFDEISILQVKDWKVVHLIAYWCSRYQDHYKINYSLRFNSTSPSKSYETWQIRKLASIISSNPEILKDYIDWFFINKIILKKKRITSLAFLTDIKNCNEFKLKVLMADNTQSINRTTSLPQNVLQLADELKIECKTYGDLSFLHKITMSNEVFDNDNLFITRIVEAGFDLSLLDKVK